MGQLASDDAELSRHLMMCLSNQMDKSSRGSLNSKEVARLSRLRRRRRRLLLSRLIKLQSSVKEKHARSWTKLIDVDAGQPLVVCKPNSLWR